MKGHLFRSGDGAVLCLLLFLHLVVRLALLPHIADHMVGGFSEIMAEIASRNPMALWLPIPIEPMGARVHWQTTGLVLVEMLRRILPLHWIYVLVSGACVVLSYVAARSLCASRSVAFTFAGLFVFGSQLNYTFVHPHVGTFYFLYCYLLVNLLALVKILIGAAGTAWRVAYVVSLLAAALFLEVWLNYALFLFAFLLVVAAWAHRRVDAALGRRAMSTWACALVIAVAYVAIRASFPHNLALPGSEEEIITRYRHASLALEDLASNVITYVFICFATYLPSVFLGTYSLVHLGADVIKAGQNGYSTPYLGLVVDHHVFFWYHYAGIVSAAFCALLALALKRAFVADSAEALVVVGIAILIVAGCASHSLIKYRFYMSVPVLAYKAVVGTFGVAVLVGYALQWVRTHRSPALYRACLTGTWAVILTAFVTHGRDEIALLKIVGLVAPDARPFLRW